MTIVWEDDLTQLDAEHMNLLEQVARKGQANGYAALGADGLVPPAQLPPFPDLGVYQLESEKGVANGYAGLGADGLVPVAQLPDFATDVDLDEKLDIASVAPSGATLFRNRLLAADVYPAFAFSGAGALSWGLGGATPPDIMLYRRAIDGMVRLDAPNGLGLSHFLDVGSSIVAGSAITAYSGAAYSTSLGFTGGGKSAVIFGNASDTRLYRESAALLKTDGGFDLAGGGGQLTFAGDATANLFRGGAGFLSSSARWEISGGAGQTALYLSGAATTALKANVAAASVLLTNALSIPETPAFRILGNGKIEWGASGAAAPDTNLYRNGAGLLKTDGDFQSAADIYARQGNAAGQIALSGNGIYFGTALDTRLYRAYANGLKTDSDLLSNSVIVANDGNASWRTTIGYTGGYAGITMGGDTTLFRYSANTVKTDGQIIAGLSIGVPIVAAPVSGGQGNKFPVYNLLGALMGYVPIYAA